MKRTLVLCLFLLLIPLTANAQKTLQDAATSTGAGSDLEINVGAQQTNGVISQVSGSFSGTITWRATVDGTNYIDVMCTNLTANTTATTATAAGLYSCLLPRVSKFRAPVTTYGSGSITVVAAAAVGVARLSTGGVTIGTTAITGGTSGRVLFDNAGAVGEDADLTFLTDTLTVTKAVIGGGSAITSSGPGGALTTLGFTTPGTSVATALGVNVGSAGAVVVNGGAGGTPSSINLTNGTALPLTTGVTGVLPAANGGAGTVNGLLKANGSGTVSAAAAGSDYVATEADPVVKAINGLVKSNGSTISAASAGTDYLAPTGSGAGLSGIPTSVSNSDGTLTISPTTGAVVASIAFGHSNTWTALQSLGSQQAKSIRLGQLLEIHATAQQGGMSSNSWSSSASVAGIFDFNRSKSATYGTMTAVAANDSLGDFGFRGADGTNFINAAFIGGYVDGAVSSGVVPGRIILQTSTSGGVLTARWSIDSSGNLNGTTGVIGLGATGSFVTNPDVAISRLGAGSAALGTGAAGSFAGSLKLTTLNAVTGIQINGTATLGNVLTGDGTNFVSAAPSAIAGGSSSTVKLGGALFDHYADVSTTHTDGTEDDLYSDSVPASTLNANGHKLRSVTYVNFVSSATASRRLKAYFGGTNIFDSGALTLSLGGDFWVEMLLIRESSTVVRAVVTVTTTSASSVPYVSYTRITGLTLTNANTLKTTGIAAGTGAASGDIAVKSGFVEFLPAQ